MTPTLHELFLDSAVAAYDRQLRLASLVEGFDWQLDVPGARLAFGDRYRWAVQFLGTESDAEGTWRWAWSNPAGFPWHGFSDAWALRNAAERDGIPELTEALVPLAEVGGHALAMVACGLCQSNAYYRCPCDDGALVVLIQDADYPRSEFDPVRRVAAVFPRAVAALPLSDHRRAWTSYLASYDLAAVANGDCLVTARDGLPVLWAAFDRRNQFIRLETHPED